MPNENYRIPTEAAVAFLLRLGLGLLFFIAGLNKFVGEGGPTAASEQIIDSFKDTYLPGFLTVSFAYVLPYVEVVLGAGLIIGLFSRPLIMAAGLLLAALSMGMMVAEQHATAANNFNYLFMAAVTLWVVSRDNRISLDTLLNLDKPKSQT